MSTTTRPDPAIAQPAVIAQREMQQQLGRCMLRIQQYERALKALVASGSITAHPEQLLEAQSRKTAAQQTKTLGQLIRMFTDEHLSDGRAKAARKAGTFVTAETVQQPLFRSQFTIAMTPERYRQTVAGLNELKDIRNKLIHHLVEQFDISTEDGCLAGTAHLRDCYAKIDAALLQLKEWTDGYARMRAEEATVLRSKEFEDAFVCGKVPGKKR
jgi:hypothetical protein